MVDNSLMNLDPFGQLSLDPNTNNISNSYPQTAPAPGTPQREQAAKAESGAMTNDNIPGMNTTGYQYSNGQQMQQQPMQISPEQAASHAGALLVQQQVEQQPPQQSAAYSNYQYNVFGEQPPQMQEQQMMQQQPQANSGTMVNHRQSLTSPPISPLWAPMSPEPSPIGYDNMAIMPSMPTGFGNVTSPEPAGCGSLPVPTLGPGSPVLVTNPFDMFAATTPTAPVADTSALTVDPFGTDNDASSPAAAQQQEAQVGEASFWNDMGFGNVALPRDTSVNSPGSITPTSSTDGSCSFSSTPAEDDTYLNTLDHSKDDTPVTLDERGLPAGGQYYNARITTSMLGAIFSSGAELRSTLFKTASNSFVEAVGDRPVISFTIDGSAADTAGIGLGNILLKVNGEEVMRTDDAVKTVGAASRPMTMEFYIPNKDVKVIKTEGQCMVKYDNHSTEAPASACEWKPKYVVVGDMLGKPHILYMYRSKAEYDIAVRESQTRCRILSVKVKQFDIRGAKIFHEQGTVKYPNKSRWSYFTIVRMQSVPIKISCSNAEAMQPILNGVAEFLANEDRMKKLRMEDKMNRQNMVGGVTRETYY